MKIRPFSLVLTLPSARYRAHSLRGGREKPNILVIWATTLAHEYQAYAMTYGYQTPVSTAMA